MLVCVLFDGLFVYRGDEYFTWIHLLEGWWVEPILVFLFWFLIAASRVYIMRGARKNIQQDIDQYTVEWEVLNDIQNTWHILSDTEWGGASRYRTPSSGSRNHTRLSSSPTLRSLDSRDSAPEPQRHRLHAHSDRERGLPPVQTLRRRRSSLHQLTQLQVLSTMERQVKSIVATQVLVAKHSVARCLFHPYTCHTSQASAAGGGEVEPIRQMEPIRDPFRSNVLSSGEPSGSRCGSWGACSQWCSSFLISQESEREAVESLDQLYLQAATILPIFLEHVKTWGQQSNGIFPTHIANVYIPAADMCDADQALQIKWAPMKCVERAVEKVSRSYSNCASRLVDIVRQMILFDNVRDMALCLESISNDPHVQILRIKNRLSPEYNASRCSGGYRDVALNLRICMPETQRLGLDGHVCELQLILKSFYERRSNEGHARWVAFRNKQAE